MLVLSLFLLTSVCVLASFSGLALQKISFIGQLTQLKTDHKIVLIKY